VLADHELPFEAAQRADELALLEAALSAEVT